MSDVMWKAVGARLDDDAPRAVLADALIERNEPRGEFISLQLEEHRGTGSLAKSKRAQALLSKHERTWLGAVHAVAVDATYVRGMVKSLSLASTERAVATALALKPTGDALLTLESLSASPAVARAWVERGITPHLVGLKLELNRVDEWIALLDERPTRWRELSLWDCDLAQVPRATARRQQQRVLELLTRCTSLKSLACEPWVLSELPSGVLQRLEDVRLSFTPHKTALAATRSLKKLRWLGCRIDECQARLDLTQPTRASVISSGGRLRLSHLPAAVTQIELVRVLGRGNRETLAPTSRRHSFVAVARSGAARGAFFS